MQYQRSLAATRHCQPYPPHRATQRRPLHSTNNNRSCVTFPAVLRRTATLVSNISKLLDAAVDEADDSNGDGDGGGGGQHKKRNHGAQKHDNDNSAQLDGHAKQMLSALAKKRDSAPPTATTQ